MRCALLLAALALPSALPSVAVAADYFFCEFHVPNLPPGHQPNSYFDRTLKVDRNLSRAGFAAQEPLNFVQQGNLVGSSYLHFAGGRRGYYRKQFDVYRFDTQAHKLIHSIVYFVSLDDHRQHFQGFSGPEYRQAVARDLVPEPLPEGHIWLAWDKSHWNCQPLPYWQYLLRSAERTLSALLSV